MRNLDLSLLHSRVEDEIAINEEIILDKEFYEDNEIIYLEPVNISGKVIYKEDEEGFFVDYFEGTIKGEMEIPDSVSLEKVNYPFSIEYDDYIPKNCIKNENMLDIFEFLWENIVLEVPLQFTKVRDLSKFHGDGWRVIREEDRENINNPFRDLLEDYKKE